LLEKLLKRLLLLRGALMQGVICRLLQGRIKRGDGHESLNLPFPFFSKRRERKGGGLAGDRIRKKGAPAKNAGGRRVLFSEGLQLRSRTGSMREQTKEYPARGKDSGGVSGLQGKSRIRILASALGPA